MRVKIFTNACCRDLEQEINEFLEDNKGEIIFCDYLQSESMDGESQRRTISIFYEEIKEDK